VNRGAGGIDENGNLRRPDSVARERQTRVHIRQGGTVRGTFNPTLRGAASQRVGSGLELH